MPLHRNSIADRLEFGAGLIGRPGSFAIRPARERELMDVLSDVLKAVRLDGAVFFNVRACEPVRAHTPNMALVGHRLMPGATKVIPFHIMLAGRCWVES